MLGRGEGVGAGRRGRQGPRKLVEVMDMLIIFILLKVSHVYTYVTTHQIAYFEYVCQFIICQLYLNEAENKKLRVRNIGHRPYFQFWATKTHLGFTHLEE